MVLGLVGVVVYYVYRKNTKKITVSEITRRSETSSLSSPSEVYKMQPNKSEME